MGGGRIGVAKKKSETRKTLLNLLYVEIALNFIAFYLAPPLNHSFLLKISRVSFGK